jgi:hypothetical protein
MIDKNAVNIKEYNFTTGFGVKALILLLERNPRLLEDSDATEILLEALKYWSNKALSEEKSK